MNDLAITATQSTPQVSARAETGVLEMRGDSYPENSFQFFSPVVAWIEEYLASSQQALNLELHLLYLNTSSVKVVMDILDMLEEAHAQGRSVSVSWFYDAENERIAELAEDFKEDCSFPFAIVLQES